MAMLFGLAFFNNLILLMFSAASVYSMAKSFEIYEASAKNEISATSATFKMQRSRPARGAWIETTHRIRQFQQIGVAPRTGRMYCNIYAASGWMGGAWIETQRTPLRYLLRCIDWHSKESCGGGKRSFKKLLELQPAPSPPAGPRAAGRLRRRCFC